VEGFSVLFVLDDPNAEKSGFAAPAEGAGVGVTEAADAEAGCPKLKGDLGAVAVAVGFENRPWGAAAG
jgi:hypothetical protein